MIRKSAAVVAALVLIAGISIGAATAFPFHWGSGGAASRGQTSGNTNQMAPPNTPEPNEGAVTLPSWAPLVKRVMPTVVNVQVVETIRTTEFGENPGDNGNQGSGFGSQSPFGMNPFGQNNPFGPFSFFFNQVPRQFTEHGLGSGVIVSKHGYILTNYHVVEHANRIKVTLMDGREYAAKVIGKDQKTDLALIKIDAGQPLPAAQLGNSNKAEVGDWVIAIGNPFGFNLTVTSGIISAKGRALGGNYDDYIQTDASINPGNSGGPLFDTRGRVIGINSAIYSSTGTNNGIGFAIPIDLAKAVMQQLREHGRVIRGWLGVDVQEVTPGLARAFGLPNTQGALVADVEKDTPASEAGLKRGDIIIKYDGQPVGSERELPEMVAQTPIGKSVPVEVLRNGKHLTLDAKIAELHPTGEVASAEGQTPGQSWGLTVQKMTPSLAQQLGSSNDHGVVITQVRPDSPADDAGLQRGDVVLEIGHDRVKSTDEFAELAHKAQKEKKPALLLVERGSATMFMVINPKG
jgi:serine protease Do